jgi:hypothetical protein
MRKDCRHEFRDILASGVKWSYVLKNGGKQGILSLRYLHLRNGDGIEIPSWVKERLEDFYYRIVYRNMRIYSLLKLIIKGFNERAKKIEMKGTHAFLFSPEDLILYLCLHFAYHHKFFKHVITLKQICDISEVIRCYRERLDWSQVEALAQKYGLSKLVYSTLFIVETLLKTGIPLDRIQGLKVDSFNVEYIDLIITERIFAHDPFPAGIIDSLSGLSFSDKIASIFKTIFLPPEEMAKRYYFSSSSPKVYFYYLLRIYHLLVDYSGIAMRLVTRHPRTVSQLEREIWVNKRQSEIDRWLESIA